MKKHIKSFNVLERVARFLCQEIFYKSTADESGPWPKQKYNYVGNNQRSVDNRGISKQGISFWAWRWRLERLIELSETIKLEDNCLRPLSGIALI